MVFASFNTPFVVFNKLVLLLIKKKLLLEGVLVAGLVVDVCWCCELEIVGAGLVIGDCGVWIVVFEFGGDENEVSGDMVRCWCCGVGYGVMVLVRMGVVDYFGLGFGDLVLIMCGGG
jgi:hypothetical protein